MSVSEQAWALARRGRYDQALELLELEIAVTEEPEASRLRIDAADIAIEAHQLGRGFEHATRAATVLQDLDPGRWLDAMCSIADAQYDLGDLASAERTYHSVLPLLVGHGDAMGEARVWMELGNVASARGDHTEADRRYNKASRLYELIGGIEDLARLGINWGTTLRDLDRIDDARRVLTRARQQATTIGSARLVADCDCNLATVAATIGDLDDATQLYRSARVTYAELGLDTEVADCDDSLGAYACTAGRYSDAIALHQAAAETYSRHAHPVQRAVSHVHLAHALLHDGRPADAAELAERSATDLARHGHTESAEWARGILVSIHLAAGDIQAASHTLDRYRTSAQQRGSDDAWLDVSTGEVACAAGDTATAVDCFERATAHYRTRSLPLVVADLAAIAAEALIRAGDPDAAASWLAAAIDGFDAAGLPARVTQLKSL